MGLKKHSKALCVVFAIAAMQTAATQFAKLSVQFDASPFFLMWLSTSFNLVFAVPLAFGNSFRAAFSVTALGSRPARLLLLSLPFYVLWALSNTLYVSGLRVLPASLVSSLFSLTPSIVGILSVPVLHRPLSVLALLAVSGCALGTTLIAEPWQQQAHANGTSASVATAQPPQLAGILCVLGAAAAAASYKVLFRRLFDEAPAALVLLLLAALAMWSLSLGSLFLLAIGEDFRATEDGATLTTGWSFILAKSVFDLAFNFLIAYGITLIHPLFISVGTILAVPCNLAVEIFIYLLGSATQASALDLWSYLGMGAIFLSFGLLLLDERRRGEGSTADAARVEEHGESKLVIRDASASQSTSISGPLPTPLVPPACE